MEGIDYLPLGSIVIVRGAIKKTMVIARGLAANLGGETAVFDYGGCLYPEGLMGDQIMYFNHADIAKVVFQGFSDEDNELMVANIRDWLKTVPYKQADSQMINQQIQASNQSAANNQQA